MQVYNATTGLVQDDETKLADIMTFIGKSDSELKIGFLFGTNEAKAVSRVSRQYKNILQVAKYTMRPLFSNMTEQARVRDMNEILPKHIDARYGRMGPGSYINFSPALLYCSFEGNEDAKACQATTTFTETGLGYTFNTGNFFDVHQRNSSMDIFCQEIVARTDQDLCSLGLNNQDKQPALITNNGAKFALRLVLNTPSHQKLSIHSPHSTADTRNNFMQPAPGTHTTVVVTPRIISLAEGSLSDEEKSVRGCHYQPKDGNPLQLYQNYTRDNCMFECHLKKSMDGCDCVPWNYPKLDPNVKTCSQNETSCFAKAMVESSKKNSNCSHCIDECYKVDYEYTIDTKPLDMICEEEEAIDKAANKEANKNIQNFLPKDYSLLTMGMSNHMFSSCPSYVEKNAAVVDTYIGPAYVVQISRRHRVTFIQQLGNLGNAMNLLGLMKS